MNGQGKSLCSCLVCVKERIGIDMPIGCIYKEESETPILHHPKDTFGETNKENIRMELAEGIHITGSDHNKISITVEATQISNHAYDLLRTEGYAHDLIIEVVREKLLTGVTIRAIDTHRNNIMSVFNVPFPRSPRIDKKLIAEYAERLGGMDKVDLMAHFLNESKLGEEFMDFLDKQEEEYRESEKELRESS